MLYVIVIFEKNDQTFDLLTNIGTPVCYFSAIIITYYYCQTLIELPTIMFAIIYQTKLHTKLINDYQLLLL